MERTMPCTNPAPAGPARRFRAWMLQLLAVLGLGLALACSGSSSGGAPGTPPAEHLAITAQPAAQTVTEGGSATFTVAAAGVPAPTYQWQRMVSGAWADLQGETGAAFTTAAALPQDNGAAFRCRVASGAARADSDPALLVVDWLHVLAQPVAQSAPAGQSASFTVAADGFPAGLTYQWQRNAGAGWADLAGAVAPTCAFTAAAGDNGTQYRCRIANAALAVTSLPAALASGLGLSVTVTGLPAGLDAAVTVSGPGGFSRALTGTGTLLVQQAGAYSVSAAAVQDPAQPSAGGLLGTGAHLARHPWRPVQSVTVPAGGQAAVEVVYPLRSFTVPVPDGTSPGTSVPMVFVLVPAGSFTMGAADAADHTGTVPDNVPAHPVTFATAFYLAKFPCTQRQWRAVTGANPSEFTPANGYPDPLDLERPVENTGWGAIRAAGTGFLDLLNGALPGYGFRLPSEAEYEHALRAGTGTPWFFGGDPARAQSFAWVSPPYTSHPVGTRAPNAWGLHDLVGNVLEWCEDDAHSDYTGAPADGRAWIDAPTRGGARITRGMSLTGQGIRSSARGAAPAAGTYSGWPTGFRLALGVPVTADPAGPGLCLTLPGLPEGVAGAVDVAGPGGYARRLTAPGALGGLAAGTYTLTSATVYDPASRGLGLANGGSLGSQDLAIRPVTPVLSVTVPAAGTVEASMGYGDPAPMFSFAGGATLPMVFIPAGSFTMGSPAAEAGRGSTEGPQHTVTLTAPFHLSATPVTQQLWSALMGSNPSAFGAFPMNPVESVSWNELSAFLSALNAATEGRRPLGTAFRLPTEAEWEYAARAGSAEPYFWGGPDGPLSIHTFAWFAGNAAGTTRTVATKAPNAWGLYDMSGNVWQWCQDWFGPYGADPATDPGGPAFGAGRVLRGGGFSYDPGYLRSAARAFADPASAFNALGFRVALAGGAPVIAAGPASQTIFRGDPVTFTVLATGTGPLHYQWKLNGNGFGPDADRLTIDSADESYAGSYTVTVSNAVGSATSGPAVLTIKPPPVLESPFITVPPMPQIVSEGDTVTFTVTATGSAPLHYHWKKDGGDVGGDADSLTLTGVRFADAGQYSVAVSNMVGTWTSGPATLTVNPAVVITTQPAGTEVLVGDGFSLSVAAAGAAPLHYQWKRDGTVVGADASQFAVASALPGDAGSYTVTVHNTVGSAISAAATVAVTTQPVAPAITAQPAGQTVSAGFGVTFSVAASGTRPLHYQWKRGTTGVGGDAASFSLASAQGADAGSYTVTVSNAGGSVTSDPALLTVQGGAPSFTLPGGVPLALCVIPAGSFTMGVPAAEHGVSYPEEGPQHTVAISRTFYMGSFEVTQAQWKAVKGNNPSSFSIAGGGASTDDLTRPVEQVSYLDIAGPGGFLAALNALTTAGRPAGMVFRLPTEAEWEYAARAGTTTRFFWGDDPSYSEFGPYAWWRANSGAITHGTGELKTPNAFGLYNVSGNVWEWCQDYYDASYYANSPLTDPPGPAGGTERMLRGGDGLAWDMFAARSGMRLKLPPDQSSYMLGFRLALAPPVAP